MGQGELAVIDYSILLDPQYSIYGVEAVLTLDGDVVHDDLTVIDKTAGLSIGDNVETPTLKPAAIIRMQELTDKGITREQLDDALVRFNENTWKISSTQPRPVPNGGESKGELLLWLYDHPEDEDTESTDG